jgi:hypothetical protein
MRSPRRTQPRRRRIDWLVGSEKRLESLSVLSPLLPFFANFAPLREPTSQLEERFSQKRKAAKAAKKNWSKFN